MTEMMGAFAAMLGKMGNAFDRLGGTSGAVDAAAAAEPTGVEIASGQIPSELAARLAAQDAAIEEKDAEIRRMRLELEQLRGAGEHSETMTRSEPELQTTAGETKAGADEAGGDLEENDWITADDFFGEESAESFFGEDDDEEESEGEGTEESDADEEDKNEGFDLTAFLNRSIDQARTLSLVDIMWRDGEMTRAISYAELVELIENR